MGYELTDTQCGLVVGAAALAVAAIAGKTLLFSSAQATTGGGSGGGQRYYHNEDEFEEAPYSSPSASPSASFAAQLQSAYDQGYADGGSEAERRTMTYDPPPLPPRPKFKMAPTTPLTPPPASGGGFGMWKLMSMAFLAKNIYALGGQPFSVSNMLPNFNAQSTMNKVFLAMAVLRLFNMSPI